tara:strand:- start:2394 stop:2780 length:387 start_codon:yes stop_codon:yes gene_type:complete
MGNSNFDTNRFIETSTPRQIQNGTMMFMDSHNPGVYYSASRNGNVNRIIKTTEQTISTGDNETTMTNTRKRTRYNRVNYRQPNNGSFVPLHRLNDQLRRIQHVAEDYDSSEITAVYTNNTNTIVVTPR